jgi:hypothetical protein
MEKKSARNHFCDLNDRSSRFLILPFNGNEVKPPDGRRITPSYVASLCVRLLPLGDSTAGFITSISIIHSAQ